MKTTAILLAILCTTNGAFAQGVVSFANSSSTLISADGVPMPVSGTKPFNFALFLAPSTTVDITGITPGPSDPNFQFTEVYNTNSASLPGRLVTRNGLGVGFSQGYGPGSTVDFIVRGWSANAGATWVEVLANWNNGSPLVPMFIGASTVGNNAVLSGGASPDTNLFGVGAHEVLGFNMIFVPEPSTLTMLILCGLVLFVSIRDRHRRPT